MTVHIDDDIRNTLALGLYSRFKHFDTENSTEKEDAYDFEYFVVEIMTNCLGGDLKVTKCSGDFGIVIIHRLGDGNKVLGQVKCYAPDRKVSYEPISIIHSNMVKQSWLTKHSKGFFEILFESFDDFFNSIFGIKKLYN